MAKARDYADNMAESIQPFPEVAACSENGSTSPAEEPWDKRGGTDNLFAGQATGAWLLSGGRAKSGYFWVYMSDNNAYAPGELLVHMKNEEGRWAEMSVRVVGGESVSEEFDGKEWEASSTLQRAAIAKAALIRNATLAASECGGRISSLDDELATFEMAFTAFDRRTP